MDQNIYGKLSFEYYKKLNKKYNKIIAVHHSIEFKNKTAVIKTKNKIKGTKDFIR